MGQYNNVDLQTYGCTLWQPEPPPQKTEESLENKRQMLMELFSHKGSSRMKRADVINLWKNIFSVKKPKEPKRNSV